MTPWVLRLIVANVFVYFLEQTVRGVANYLVFVPQLALIHPWTFVTYTFVHDPNGITHILFNMLALYFFGPRVEERIGGQRFLTLYFIGGVSGAILSFFFAWNASVIGASGAVFGVMLAFARYWPDVQILMFFFLPMPARFAVGLMALLALWSGFQGSQGGVADFAHLGGFAGAYLYLLYLDRRAGVKKFRKATVAAPPAAKLGDWKRVNPQSVHVVNRDEVNRILDKISAKGVDSLTPQERLFLSSFVPKDDRR